MFEELKESIRDDFVRYIYRVEFVRQEQARSPRAAQENRARGRVRRAAPATPGRRGRQRQDPAQRALPVRQRPEVQEVPRRVA